MSKSETSNQKEKTMDSLKAKIEKMAQDEGKTELEIITLLQVAANHTNNQELLNQLCELKWDYIE
jgi:hypothetical protein